MSKVYHRSQRDDWETPPALFNLLDREFAFNLDVCASMHNNKVGRYFGEGGIAEDGLAAPWQGETCWMNPPYSQTAAWLRKAVVEAATNGALVVALVAARTDTRAWHADVWPCAAEVRFLKGRVRFVGGAASAPFPSAIIVFNPRIPRPKAWGWDWFAAAAQEQADV